MLSYLDESLSRGGTPGSALYHILLTILRYFFQLSLM